MALAVEILAGRLTFLLPELFLLLPYPGSLETANTRIVSPRIRAGAEIRTVPDAILFCGIRYAA